MRGLALLGRAAALAAAVTVLAPPARAQSAADKAAAEALFDQGRAAMQEGDFGKACGLLERSQHIESAVGTLLYLAECYEKSGRTASAWATFREAADAADAAREPDRAKTGRKRAERLEPLLSRLTIQIAPENQQLAGLAVQRRGQEVQAALWNVPVPVDPGEYAVSASAPGYEAWSQTITVPDHAARVSLTVPPLKKAAPEIAAAPPAPPPEPKSPMSTTASGGLGSGTGALPPEQRSTPSSGRRTAAYLLGGAGIAGIGVGSYFGIRAITKNKEAKEHCPRGYQCDDAQGASAATDAKHAARISDVALGVGAMAVIGGMILLITAPSSGPRVTASLGPGSVTLEGSFP
jgi:serine/threonine-protein kinase